jgi:hypothetical protein
MNHSKARARGAKSLPSRLVKVALLLWAASLALPVGYGAEIWGLIRGWTYLLMTFFLPFSPETWRDNSLLAMILFILSGLSYIATPLAPLAALLSHRLAVALAAFGLIAPMAILWNGGLYIHRPVRNEYVLNSGGLSSLVAALIMLAAWIVVIWQEQSATRRFTNRHAT